MLTKPLLPVVCAALTLAACAGTPQVPALAKAQDLADSGCVPQTATRLPTKSGECAGFGVRFTKEQLNSTGQPYAEQELRMLDNSLVANGH
jgi:hypothetical protein